MSDTRERLVEIIQNSVGGCARHWAEVIADGMIAHGVTVQRWIPVAEKLPDLIPCRAGTAYSEAVNILTSGRKVLTAIWNGEDFIADAAFWDAEGEEITHWSPVHLPLPALPSEDNTAYEED